MMMRKTQNALNLAMVAMMLVSAYSPTWASPFESAMRHYQQGDYPMAIDFLKQALSRDAGNPNARYYLADCFLKVNRLHEAKVEYEQILALSPDSPAAKLSRGGLIQIKELLEPKGTSVVTRATATLSTTKRNGPDKLEDLMNTGNGYIDEIAEGGLTVRWSVNAMPIRLYIERAPIGVRHFEQSFIYKVKTAMDQWMDALNHEVDYVLVDSPDQADIRVTWVNGIDTKGFTTESGTTYTAGVTIPNIQGDRLQSMDVRLGTFDIRGNPQSGDEIYLLALHELGHAMGIRGHSPNDKDIMYAQNQKVSKLSQRDINTIRQLYGQEVDVTNLAPDKNKPKDQAREDRVTQKLDEEITKMELLVKINGTHLNWNNLGSSYFQRGKMLSRSGKKEEAKGYNDKALSAFNKALELEPLSGSTYYNRCIVNEETKEYDKALGDIDTAIRLDSRETKYFLERTFVLTNMKKKAEALAALEDYLVREPQAQSSEPVQKVRRILAKI